ncbi:MAG: D-2-hydroxyacid dehydrogenase [Ardenticatenaceae bacterium]
MGTILIGLQEASINGAQRNELARLAPDMKLVVTDDRARMRQVLEDVEIAAGWLPPELVRQMPRLRWYQQWPAGADWLLRHPEAAERAFILTNTSGLHAIPMTEQVLAYLFAFARRLPDAVRTQGRREWWAPRGETLFEVTGKTMLLIGVGAIGAKTAQAAAALGVRVLGVRRDPAESVAGVARMVGPDELDKVLPEADFVVLTVPRTAQTKGMIGEHELRQMKPSAILINIGRGGTVDDEALARALREGWIAGAGLDVFETEPLPAESPLWEMDNVIITCHYGGATPHYNERAMEIFLDNLRRFRAGEPLRNVVDKGRGY